MTVGSLGESGLLARIIPRLRGAQALLGPGDDAAVIAAPDGRFVFSVDTLVQDQDFRLDWNSGYSSSGYDVGWKSAAQNLSDINAMGAVATAAVISLTLPHETPVGWVEDLADGFSAAVRELGASRCSIAGGDLGRGREISITAAVTGDLQGRAPVLRSGARPGDSLAVCGVLGMARAGLEILEGDRPHSEWTKREVDLANHQLRPRPQLWSGPLAAITGATAMMDLSDGVARDVQRMATASGVCIELDQVALDEEISPLADRGWSGEASLKRYVLGGGEDFGVLATFPSEVPLPEGFRKIGMVVTGETFTVSLCGVPVLKSLGFDHFNG